MAGKEKDKKISLVLLDAQAILHRAYHALPDFSSNKGEPTGALYGLSLMLLKIISEFKPDYIVACFDVKGPTYRHEAYEGYKAKRAKTKDDLIWQIEKSKELFTAFNVPVYEKQGFEADDLLGTIVEKLKDRKDLEIIIASGDMDTLQLVKGDRVKVYTLKKGIKDTIIYDEPAVLERFGFQPELLPDYKGLRGDPSDNIIGVPGIGEKTAGILIKEFGTIEKIYKILKKDPAKLEQAGVSPRVIEILKENEEEAIFSKALATINFQAPIDFELPKENWLSGLKREEVLRMFSQLEFRALSDRVKNNFFGGEEKRQLTLDENKTSDISESKLKETAIALWLIDSNITNPGLDEVLGFADSQSFERAGEKIFAELKKRKLEDLFKRIEKPLIPIVEKMEDRGIKIDTAFLKKLSAEYHQELKKLEQAIWSLSGLEFNINSPKQLGQVLFDGLKLKPKNQKKTSTGAKSTRESELEKMKGSHPVIPLILEYREFQKLLSTYIDNIPEMLSSDGRLHAKFSQTGTTTGRMSSSSPNLQNIPIKTELGKRIRGAFVAEGGFLLSAFDYSQIELRVAAFLSRDEKLLEIFKKGEDVHSAVASVVFDVPLEKVDYEMRRRAKVINFGIIYGMGVNALRANLGTSREEAQKFLDDYFKNFSTLSDYLEQIKKQAEKNGYTETLFGRRRYFPTLRSKMDYIRSAAERMAVNAPLQGTAADIIKLAMIAVDKYIENNNLQNKAYLVLQIHDELVYEVAEDLAEEVVPKIKKIMEEVLTLEETGGVPLVVNAEIGKNWGELKEVKKTGH